MAWSQHHKTFPVNSPPVFNGESNNVFCSFFIYTVLPHRTFNDECAVLAYFTFLQKVLTLPEFLRNESLVHQLYLTRSKRRSGVAIDVIDERLVHGYLLIRSNSQI